MAFMLRALIVLVLVIGSTALSQAQRASTDVTQWRGPNRDGVITGFTEPATWPEQLTQRWKIDVGLGYATPLVVGNRVYVFSRQGEDEVMSALDADSGKVLWRTAYPASYEMNSAAKPHGPGPKSTPVLSNGRLFAIGMTGTVTAFDAASGKTVWQKPGPGGAPPMYTSHSFSPLVEGGNVIFHVGGHNQGALTAFDVNTGAVKWSWNGDGPGYGSPIVADLGGVRQIVTITQGKLVGVNAVTGALLWERPHVSPNFTNSITPVLAGENLIVWGNGPVSSVRVARRDGQWAAETVWENADLPGRMSNGVFSRNVMFGLTSRNMGQYYAVDTSTGKVLWTSEGRQAANVALAMAGNVLFSLQNDGQLVVLRASTTAFEVLRRYKVAEPETFTTWTQPSVSGNRIFVKDVSTLTLWTVS